MAQGTLGLPLEFRPRVNLSALYGCLRGFVAPICMLRDCCVGEVIFCAGILLSWGWKPVVSERGSFSSLGKESASGVATPNLEGQSNGAVQL